MPNIKEFETALVKQLTAGKVDKAFLKTTSSLIVNMKKEGLVIDQINIKGKPHPDRMIINGTVNPEFWSKFNSFGGAFRRFDVFPYGIVAPDGFRFKGTLGI